MHLEVTMDTSIIFFFLGVLFLKLSQELFNIVVSYKLFKYTEIYSLSLLADLEVYRLQALQIIKICYNEADRQEEFPKVEEKLNERFRMLQNLTIAAIKHKLPYKTNYETLEEAHKEVEKQFKEKKDE